MPRAPNQSLPSAKHAPSIENPGGGTFIPVAQATGALLVYLCDRPDRARTPPAKPLAGDKTYRAGYEERPPLGDIP